MKFVRERDLQSGSADPSKFTEGVWQTEALTAAREEGLRGHRFVYRPGARSHWHTHTGEQALVVLAGRGTVVRWGEETGTDVGAGDWVHVEPGEKHWHGAADDDVFVHLAITASGTTEWHGPVAPPDDDAGPPPSSGA